MRSLFLLCLILSLFGVSRADDLTLLDGRTVSAPMIIYHGDGANLTGMGKNKDRSYLWIQISPLGLGLAEKELQRSYIEKCQASAEKLRTVDPGKAAIIEEGLAPLLAALQGNSATGPVSNANQEDSETVLPNISNAVLTERAPQKEKHPVIGDISTKQRKESEVTLISAFMENKQNLRTLKSGLIGGLVFLIGGIAVMIFSKFFPQKKLPPPLPGTPMGWRKRFPTQIILAAFAGFFVAGTTGYKWWNHVSRPGRDWLADETFIIVDAVIVLGLTIGVLFKSRIAAFSLLILFCWKDSALFSESGNYWGELDDVQLLVPSPFCIFLRSYANLRVSRHADRSPVRDCMTYSAGWNALLKQKVGEYG